MKSYCIQNPDAVDSYWSQDHPTWSNFRMVPYPTVLRLIDQLSDDKYDTVPKQPPPSVPTKQQQSQKTKTELKQKPAATGGVAPTTSTSASSLHEVPHLMINWKSRTYGVKCYCLRAGKPTIRLLRDLSGG